MPTPSNHTLGKDPHRRAHAGLEAALHAFLRFNIGVVALTLAARAFGGPFTLSEATLVGGAVAVAAGFGLTLGLLVGALALMVISRAWGLDLRAASLRPEDVFFGLAFATILIGVGYFTDQARRRPPTPRQPRLQIPAAPPPARPAAQDVGLAAWWRQGHRQTAWARTLGGLALALAGGAVGARWHAALGPAWTLAAVLAPALVAAEWTGGARGLLIAGLAGALLIALLPGARAEVELSRALGVVLLSALGWRIGALGEAARRHRLARTTLERAGASFASCEDEAGLRAALVDSLRRLDRRARVELCDEHGHAAWAPARSSPNAAAPRADRAVADGAQVRRLSADNRDFGEVRWEFSGPAADRRADDQTAAALIDLAAAAIARVRLAAERVEMEHAMRAEQLRTILLDAVSHHFRSPLAGILGSVTSILSLPDPHERGVDREFLLIIKEQANRLGRYVDNFLSLARLEAGAIEVNPSEVNLEVLIYDVWDTFGASGGAHRYLQVDLDVEVVRSDAGLLTQIFGNVLENAIKYSPEESIVTVSGVRQPDGLLIEITDQGRGVPEAALERMFGRFHRLQAGETPGMGLGLYITRSLVDILGGEVRARNRSDGQTGLVMSIALPLTTTHA